METVTPESNSAVIENNRETMKELLVKGDNCVKDNSMEKENDASPEVEEKLKEEKGYKCLPKSALKKEVVERLSQGLLSLYLLDLQKVASDLTELSKNQNILIETIEQENTRFSEALSTYSLESVLIRTKHYQTKLINIKKEMTALYDRSAKLKKQALRLQEQKQKEALQREQLREEEVERERQLTAKVASKS
ncbi:biogenesis of lysosomal organelles complex 1 subunit pallidin isoform X1 [Tachypleus tridentatus]|uniref:biogenesis of lysosomal organelles complex 1 subunit pallidin isoform X1 n=1 Tax=Tachypleus tridentatus TaxID=6853 RepID=UPI003FD3A4F2